MPSSSHTSSCVTCYSLKCLDTGCQCLGHDTAPKYMCENTNTFECYFLQWRYVIIASWFYVINIKDSLIFFNAVIESVIFDFWNLFRNFKFMTSLSCDLISNAINWVNFQPFPSPWKWGYEVFEPWYFQV